jgi:hypothetical protein
MICSNISPFIYIKGADDSHIKWMSLTTLFATYIYSRGVVTILFPLILSFLCLLHDYFSVPP